MIPLNCPLIQVPFDTRRPQEGRQKAEISQRTSSREIDIVEMARIASNVQQPGLVVGSDGQHACELRHLATSGDDFTV